MNSYVIFLLFLVHMKYKIHCTIGKIIKVIYQFLYVISSICESLCKVW